MDESDSCEFFRFVSQHYISLQDQHGILWDSELSDYLDTCAKYQDTEGRGGSISWGGGVNSWAEIVPPVHEVYFYKMLG